MHEHDEQHAAAVHVALLENVLRFVKCHVGKSKQVGAGTTVISQFALIDETKRLTV